MALRAQVFSKFSQHIAPSGIQILNTKKSRVCKGRRFFQIYVFYHCQKTGLIDLPGKRAPTKVKYLLTVCQILRNFTKGNARKFTFSFAFCAHVDVSLRVRANYLNFRPQRACDRKTIGSHLKPHLN